MLREEFGECKACRLDVYNNEIQEALNRNLKLQTNLVQHLFLVMCHLLCLINVCLYQRENRIINNEICTLKPV